MVVCRLFEMMVEVGRRNEFIFFWWYCNLDLNKLGLNIVCS